MTESQAQSRTQPTIPNGASPPKPQMETEVSTLKHNLIGTWECLYATMTHLSTSPTNTNDLKTIHPFTPNINGNIIYSTDGWMSSLLQIPADKLPLYTAGSISGTAEEVLAAGKGTQGYVGRYEIFEVGWMGEEGEKDRKEVDAEKGKVAGCVRFKLYHDIKIGIPPNWIGERQVRVGEMWEEVEEENEDGGAEKKRMYMKLGTEWPLVMEGREYRVEVGWRKRS
jgi:Lipocalin-like domain